MFRNQMPRYEVLSADAMAMLDKGWRKLMTEIGVEFMDERALELFRKAGQRVEGNSVFLDPETKSQLAVGDPHELLAHPPDPKVERFLTRGGSERPA